MVELVEKGRKKKKKKKERKRKTKRTRLSVGSLAESKVIRLG